MPRDALFVRTGWSRRWLDAALALWVAGFLGLALVAQSDQHLRNDQASKVVRTEPGQAGPVQLADEARYLIWIESRSDLRRSPELQAVMKGGIRTKATETVSVTPADGPPLGQEDLRRPTVREKSEHRYWFADGSGHWQAKPVGAAALKPGRYTLDTPLRGPGVRLAISKVPPATANDQPHFLALAGAGAALYLFTVLRRRSIDRRALGPNPAVLAG
ncbi:hypothetical protein [Streptomyces virginiae]|uniref:hypothetical protein n=1 Tax=Streptomyces virginiae TaxID=1961 RepID=UPI00324B8474